jgi:uncharacterized tellurite resistance protein B-like protein
VNYFDSHEQLTAHFLALQLVAYADGALQPSEEAFLNNLLSVYRARDGGLANLQLLSDADANPPLEEVLESFTTRRQKMILLQDLYSMATLSEGVERSELDVIERIAAALGVSENELQELGRLNEQVLEANKRLATFLFN